MISKSDQVSSLLREHLYGARASSVNKSIIAKTLLPLFMMNHNLTFLNILHSKKENITDEIQLRMRNSVLFYSFDLMYELQLYNLTHFRILKTQVENSYFEYLCNILKESGINLSTLEHIIDHNNSNNYVFENYVDTPNSSVICYHRYKSNGNKMEPIYKPPCPSNWLVRGIPLQCIFISSSAKPIGHSISGFKIGDLEYIYNGYYDPKNDNLPCKIVPTEWDVLGNGIYIPENDCTWQYPLHSEDIQKNPLYFRFDKFPRFIGIAMNKVEDSPSSVHKHNVLSDRIIDVIRQQLAHIPTPQSDTQSGAHRVRVPVNIQTLGIHHALYNKTYVDIIAPTFDGLFFANIDQCANNTSIDIISSNTNYYVFQTSILRLVYFDEPKNLHSTYMCSCTVYSINICTRALRQMRHPKQSILTRMGCIRTLHCQFNTHQIF
jgi:hypothetical protein